MKFLKTKNKHNIGNHSGSLLQQNIKIYQNNREWGMKKCCHLVATLGSNNLKPVKMGA